MAHASKSDAVKNHMKKLRARNAKDKAKLAQMEPEERARIEKRMNEKTDEEILQLMLWDFNSKQLHFSKYPDLLRLLKEKLKNMPQYGQETTEMEEKIKEVKFRV